MAEALAQSTGRPQIVAASRAVGASNAAVGIHTAKQDSAPLVALVGQVQTGFANREAFQESDLAGGIGSLATWATQIDKAGDTPAALDMAWRRLPQVGQDRSCYRCQSTCNLQRSRSSMRLRRGRLEPVVRPPIGQPSAERSSS